MAKQAATATPTATRGRAHRDGRPHHHRPHGDADGHGNPRAVSDLGQYPADADAAHGDAHRHGHAAHGHPHRRGNPRAGGVGERPGWGYGDANHEHTGPPGNPDAESPCAKHEEPADSGEERGEHGKRGGE